MSETEYATRTVMLPLPVTDEQRETLRSTIQQYNTAWNTVAAWCQEHRTTNRTKIHEAMYYQLRADQPEMLAQFSTMAMRFAPAAIKSFNSNNPSRRWTKTLVRKRQSMPLDKRVFSLRGNLLTISTQVKAARVHIMAPDLPTWFANAYPDAALQAATLHISRQGQVSIRLIYRVSVPEPSTERTQVVGIDRGLYKLAVTSEGGEYSGSHVREVRRRYRHTRKTLQRQGTRSAKRRLKALSGREKRFTQDVNHRISKELASDPSVKTYVLEDLTGIRNPNRHRGKTRTWIGQWTFADLEFKLAYKCAYAGIEIAHIDPRYTSQRCNQCGVIDKASRTKGRYQCQHCGHRDNADLNAAKNIRDLHTLSASP